MDSLAVSSKQVQRLEGKFSICYGKQLSVPEHAGVTSLVGKIAGDNVNHGLCDSRDYFASPSLIPQTS